MNADAVTGEMRRTGLTYAQDRCNDDARGARLTAGHDGKPKMNQPNFSNPWVTVRHAGARPSVQWCYSPSTREPVGNRPTTGRLAPVIAS